MSSADSVDATPDETLVLKEKGIQMPEMLRGYSGKFEVRTANVDGVFHTADGGLPDAEFFDGVIAVYPDDDGDYNPELREGLMAISTDLHEEKVFRVEDTRNQGGED